MLQTKSQHETYCSLHCIHATFNQKFHDLEMAVHGSAMKGVLALALQANRHTCSKVEQTIELASCFKNKAYRGPLQICPLLNQISDDARMAADGCEEKRRFTRRLPQQHIASINYATSHTW
jgi:hypothetical protein